MQLILNIGLKGIHTQVTPASALHASRTLRKHGFGLVAGVVHHSATEPTLVATVEHEGGGVHGDVRQVAAALNQECIACWKPTRNKGVMLGATIDQDDSWGPFNPALFLMPDGATLAQPQEV